VRKKESGHRQPKPLASGKGSEKQVSQAGIARVKASRESTLFEGISYACVGMIE
jgi:hypothetical protein